MGMAASQARFLGLTARKTNTEYEGQQVNQERTALANQSANLYNKMLAMKVPTPPDTTDYYNMRYTFNVGYDQYEITDYSAAQDNTNGAYDVTVRHTYDETQAFNRNTNNVTLGYNGTNYTINVGNQDTVLTPVVRQNLADELGYTNPNFYSYTTTANSTTYYINEDDLNTYLPNGTTNYTGAISQNYYDTVSVTDYETLAGVDFTVDSSGNFTKIGLADNHTYTLTTENVQDDEGYAQAMNSYTEDKNLYDREVANINAQTAVLEQQDKTLELRLKQLDTEQSALQTEMDAVSKVIEKNVESTFKTFA